MHTHTFLLGLAAMAAALAVPGESAVTARETEPEAENIVFIEPEGENFTASPNTENTEDEKPNTGKTTLREAISSRLEKWLQRTNRTRHNRFHLPITEKEAKPPILEKRQGLTHLARPVPQNEANVGDPDINASIESRDNKLKMANVVKAAGPANNGPHLAPKHKKEEPHVAVRDTKIAEPTHEEANINELIEPREASPLKEFLFDSVIPPNAAPAKAAVAKAASAKADPAQLPAKSAKKVEKIDTTDPLKDPNQWGPNSPNYVAGPFMPLLDADEKKGIGGHVVDPTQKYKWDLMISPGNESLDGLPPASLNWNGHTRRSQEGYPVHGKLQASSSSNGRSKHNQAMLQTKPSLFQRAKSLIRRVTIGAQVSDVGLIEQNNATIDGKQIEVWNGQPGMIYLKGMGNITGCPEDNHSVILGHRIYVPKIFFHDGAGRERCRQVATMFWVTGTGEKYMGISEIGVANYDMVIIAGQCNDCYPWEVQGESRILDAVQKNNTPIDWEGEGKWGVTIALGFDYQYEDA